MLQYVRGEEAPLLPYPLQGHHSEVWLRFFGQVRVMYRFLTLTRPSFRGMALIHGILDEVVNHIAIKLSLQNVCYML